MDPQSQNPSQPGQSFVEPTADTEVQSPFAPPEQPIAPPEITSQPSNIPPVTPPPSVEPQPVSSTFTLPEQENPFIPPVAPGTSGGSSGGSGGVVVKKILAVLVLLLAIGAVLFLVITIVQRVLKKNENITLTYWGLWEEEMVVKPAIEAYERAHSNIKITYVKESKEQYRQRLEATISKGTGPDIFRFHNTWVPMIRDSLAPAPGKIMNVSEFEKTFYPVAKNDLVANNAVYGMPLEIDGLGLYYNEELLRLAGVTPPTTWEELRASAQKITVKDENGRVITGGIALGVTNNIEHFSDIAAVMMMQNGADLKNPHSKEAQDALAFYRLFAEKPNNVWDEQMDNSINAFASGKVGMIIAPSWQAATIRQSAPNLAFKIITLPQLSGANITWASYWVEGVSAKSKYIDAAWEFLAFLGSRDAVTQFYTEAARTRSFGEPYARTDLGSSITSDPIVGAYIQQAPNARSFPLASRTFDAGINDRMIKYLEDAINSMKSGTAPSSATQTMSAGFKQVLGEFGTSPATKK